MSAREWLLAAIAPASSYGARALARMAPFAPGDEAAAAQRAQRIAAVAQRVDAARLDALRAAFREAPDAQGAISRASLGDALADANFLELQRICDTILRVDSLLADAGVNASSNESIRDLARALERGRSGKSGFYLADAFADSLADSRRVLATLQSEYDELRAHAAAKVAGALGRDDVGSAEFIVMRADFDGVLPPGVRVVREAPTYRLCELDADDANQAALARRERAAADVAQAEEAARLQLSQLVRSHVEAIQSAMHAFGELDVLVAAARFTQRYDCTAARIANEPILEFENARYLPFVDVLEREGRAFQPLDLELRDVAVLTGPNMGGKTVALRTCAFIALCVSLGLPVPAKNARVALFDDVAWLGIGADNADAGNGTDAPGGLLSSFATEVVALREILARSAQRRLVLVDEFARTTTPSEGRALLLALLTRLQSLGACALVATHLGGVAEASGVKHFAVRGLRNIPHRSDVGDDVRGSLHALATSMDYSIAEVHGAHDQHSDAIALAALLGLDDEFIEAATRALHPGGEMSR